PCRGSHGLGAYLLGQRDAVRFELAIGMIGRNADKHVTAGGEDEGLDLARRRVPYYLDAAGLRQLVLCDAVIQRHAAGPRHAKSSKLFDMVFDGLPVAPGPAGDHQAADVGLDRARGAVRLHLKYSFHDESWMKLDKEIRRGISRIRAAATRPGRGTPPAGPATRTWPARTAGCRR